MSALTEVIEGSGWYVEFGWWPSDGWYARLLDGNGEERRTARGNQNAAAAIDALDASLLTSLVQSMWEGMGP